MGPHLPEIPLVFFPMISLNWLFNIFINEFIKVN